MSDTILKQNSESLSLLLTALVPVVEPKSWDVVGDDDAAMIHLRYEDWTHLMFILKPFFPMEIDLLGKKFGFRP